MTQGGSTVALKRDAQRAPRKGYIEVRHKAALDRLRAVVAKITAENLELKKLGPRYRAHSRGAVKMAEEEGFEPP